ncbi:hypothetical protein EDB85DRAFT_1975977 [Lactarius pseudohatsudake]|nr:hypothetical protein EDB85DRAFT_1975977 [Lactarius pseudohatsudake]
MMLAPPFVSIMIFSKTLGRTFWLMPRDRICTEQALRSQYSIRIGPHRTSPSFAGNSKFEGISIETHLLYLYTPDFPS